MASDDRTFWDSWDRARSPRPGFTQARAKDYGGEGSPLTADECEAIRRGRAPLPDREAATLLIERVSDCLVRVATGGPRIELLNDAYQRENRALGAALRRLKTENPCDFRDLWKWREYYGEHLDSWAQRRVYIADLFAAVRDALDALDEQAQTYEEPAWSGMTGWDEVDAKLLKLRREFSDAMDPDDFRAVGLLGVSTLEALGRAVFDPSRHVRPCEPIPKLDDAKARLEAFFAAAAPGDRYKHVRAMVRPALAQAHKAKHSPTATATDAGIACSAVALLVHVARQVEQHGAGSPDQAAGLRPTAGRRA